MTKEIFFYRLWESKYEKWMFYFQFTGIKKVMTVTENKIGFIITGLVLANIYFIFYTFPFKVKFLHPKAK